LRLPLLLASDQNEEESLRLLYDDRSTDAETASFLTIIARSLDMKCEAESLRQLYGERSAGARGSFFAVVVRSVDMDDELMKLASLISS
jgi:hypothetical protein